MAPPPALPAARTSGAPGSRPDEDEEMGGAHTPSPRAPAPPRARAFKLENDSFLKSNRGGPTPAEYEALMEEKNALAAELEKTQTELAAAQTKIEELENPPAAEEGEGDAAPAE